MKISKNPGPLPPPDDGKADGSGRAGRSGEAGRTGGVEDRGTASSGNQREAAGNLARAAHNAASNLMKAGGSAKEFADVGMKVLMQSATGGSSGTPGNDKGAASAAPSRTHRAWTNVAGALFGKAANLPADVAKAAADVAGHLREGAFDKAAGSMAGAVGDTPSMDVNQMIQSVLRQSYMEQTKDLQFHADKVKHFNDQKQQLRDQISSARQSVAEAMTGGGDTSARVGEWEEKLQSVGDDAQLANIDLQNMLQKQQQTLQTISNVSKMLHDTAMSVIRKIG